MAPNYFIVILHKNPQRFALKRLQGRKTALGRVGASFGQKSLIKQIRASGSMCILRLSGVPQAKVSKDYGNHKARTGKGNKVYARILLLRVLIVAEVLICTLLMSRSKLVLCLPNSTQYWRLTFKATFLALLAKTQYSPFL